MGSAPPFNPYPITGENPYNQPSNQNIAPLLPYNKGGIPDTSAGIKQRLTFRRKNSYLLQVAADPQGIDGLVNDSLGNRAYIDIGKDLMAWNSPFIFIPDIYSVVLINNGNAADLSLGSWHAGLYDNISNEELFGTSPPNPNSTFQKLGFELPLPILQHDDFTTIAGRDYLNYLNNVLLYFAGSIFNNANGQRTLEVQTTLIYRAEKLQI